MLQFLKHISVRIIKNKVSFLSVWLYSGTSVTFLELKRKAQRGQSSNKISITEQSKHK